MKEIISVIVPIYSVEKYLSRCIESIINQTYRNIEIILVNDGSPDNCGQICDEYAKKDERIYVIHKKNGGLSDARNAGLKIAKGEYISFVDSDDWIHEKYIEKLYDLITKSNADISMCDFIKTSDDNVKVDNSNEEITEYSNIEALDLLMGGKLNVQFVVSWGKLYKRRLFENIKFPIGRIHEDEFTTYKLLYKAKKIVFTTSKLLFYWQREDSIMGTGEYNIKNRLDALDAFEERAVFFNKVGLNDLCGKAYKSLFFLLKNTKNQIDQKDMLIDNTEMMAFSKMLENRNLISYIN